MRFTHHAKNARPENRNWALHSFGIVYKLCLDIEKKPEACKLIDLFPDAHCEQVRSTQFIRAGNTNRQD
jgi:hypothetical protein